MKSKVLSPRWLLATALIVGGAAVSFAGASFTATAADAPAAQAATPDGAKDGHHRHDRREEMRARFAAMDRHLSSDQVRDIVAGKLAMAGNANLKVGKTSAAGDVVSVDITTKTGALVSTEQYSTKTGMPEWLTKRLTTPRPDRHGKDGAQTADAHGGPGGPGDHGGDHGPGPGGHPMMHAGWHPGMMGHGRPGGFAMFGADHSQAFLHADPGHDLNLTSDQAKRLVEARLITMGNSHLKVGAAKEKDADSITVDIVASDNSLVTQETLNRHNGHPMRDHTT